MRALSCGARGRGVRRWRRGVPLRRLLEWLHLASNLLAEHLPQQPVTVVCDSKPALQALVNPRRAGLTVVLLLAKLTALATAGIPISFHWLPSLVGVAGNKEADTYTKAAHHDVVPVTRAVAASDYTRHRLRCLLTSIHPDPRVASGRAPKPLPENGLSRRDQWRSERRLVLHLFWGACAGGRETGTTMAVPFTSLLLFMQVGAGSLTSRCPVITEVNIVQGPSSQVTNPSCAADTVLENTDFNITEEYCSAAAFGRCATRVELPWAVSKHHFHVQKAVSFSLDWGRETGTTMAVPFTSLLLFMQVGAGSLTSRCPVITEVNIVQGPSSQVTNPSCAADTVLENTDFNITDEYCSAAAFGRCATRVELPWAVSKHHFHVQKAVSFSLDWGRETGTTMAVPFTSLLLFMQVGSDDICAQCVFALPVSPPVLFTSICSRSGARRPSRRRKTHFLLLRRAAFYFLLLLLCGDVELNPGPGDTILQQLLDGQNEIKQKLTAIEKYQADNKAAMANMNARMTKIEATIDRFEELRSSVAEYKSSCDSFQANLASLVHKVDDLENLLQVGEVEIERAHRLGKFSADKQRPIIVKFRSDKDKQKVLLAAKKLKGSRISISEDFSEPLRKKRRMLLEYAKEHQSEADKGYVKRDVLYLHKMKYVYDESMGKVVRV
ncbi:uncharacterized protein [Dermacentor andersoni]|uniref:uncharacterized protein n=1 Tax=Dermacentor andersoni TaxID=34620 RepID=UPI003B3B86F2